VSVNFDILCHADTFWDTGNGVLDDLSRNVPAQY
jgi:hypothetical protein